jgi:hypothetical protein
LYFLKAFLTVNGTREGLFKQLAQSFAGQAARTPPDDAFTDAAFFDRVYVAQKPGHLVQEASGFVDAHFWSAG